MKCSTFTPRKKGAAMVQKNSDRSETRKTRDKLRKAEKGQATAEELGQAGARDDTSAVSVEQEASDGPEGRGLTR